jgi:ABC-2 type transport system permease protein
VSRLVALTKRELLAYFYTPVPYLVIFLFLLMTWVVVSQLSFSQQNVRIDYMPVFGWLDFILLFLIPLLTMNSVADERSRNTLETLLTAPVTDWQVILSKWMGTFCFYVVMLAPTLVYWLVLRELAAGDRRLDSGPILSAYLGALLLGGLYIAIGIFTSTLTENPTLAAFFAFIAMIGLMVAEVVPYLRDHAPEAIRRAAEYTSQRGHFEQFLRGRIPLHDVLYFVTMIVVFQFLSVRALESRKWR